MTGTIVWVERPSPHSWICLYELRVGSLPPHSPGFTAYLWNEPVNHWVCRAGLEWHRFRASTAAEARAVAERHVATTLRAYADALERGNWRPPPEPEPEPFDPSTFGDRPPVRRFRFDAEGGYHE